MTEALIHSLRRGVRRAVCNIVGHRYDGLLDRLLGGMGNDLVLYCERCGMESDRG